MGIKEYLKYIEHELPQVKSREYDYFYLDCNYMIHYLIYKCKSDNDLYSKIFTYWDYLMSTIKIKKELLLIFDGEYDTEPNLNPKYQTHLLRSKSKLKSDDYDKQSIYPKSQIVKTFKDFLLEIVERYKKINKLSFDIKINDDYNKGEADIKILEQIYNSTQNNICICSKDSDMILIAYSLHINKNICIDILINLRPIKFINIDKLKFINKSYQFGLDYVLITILLGNDYLPKISNISYEKLLLAYTKYIKFNKPIILNEKINYNNLVEYISILIIQSDKKIKFNINNINPDRFNIYYNNFCWCLKYYKVLDNNNDYIQDLIKKDDIKIKNVINIFNFINYIE